MSHFIKYKEEQKENPLLAKPELFEAAMDEFSRKSFHEASLNDMLKAVKMNKGSFYHRFYDKMDLYLCMMEIIALDKVEYMKGRITSLQTPPDFFGQLKLLSIAGLEYARHEKRYYSFWRNYLSEGQELKDTVKNAFPQMAKDFLEQLISEAVLSGQLSSRYSQDFIYKTVSIFFYNLDAFIGNETKEEEITGIVEDFICFLKKGLV